MKTKLNWNEEFSISFENDKGVKFSSPNGKGFSILFEAESERKRLLSKGFKNVKISVRTWN